jgi:hypothetical protein
MPAAGSASVHSAPESTWRNRILDELGDVANRAVKLNHFVRSDEFLALDRRDQELLERQLRLMNDYANTLAERLRMSR